MRGFAFNSSFCNYCISLHLSFLLFNMGLLANTQIGTTDVLFICSLHFLQSSVGGYRGWCETCAASIAGTEDCRKAGRMSWGYCLPECSRVNRTEETKEEEVEEHRHRQYPLRELRTGAFTSAPPPDSNASCPAHRELEFCTGEALFSPRMQLYRRRRPPRRGLDSVTLREEKAEDAADGRRVYEHRLEIAPHRFEPRRVKPKMCLGEVGGSVWRMDSAAFARGDGGGGGGKKPLAYLTGVISR